MPNFGQHPLFLEDENIFQKSATMVRILSQFRTVPSWCGIIISVGAGKLFVLDFPIFEFHTFLIQNGDFQVPITLSNI
jgi:hypothetical protein